MRSFRRLGSAVVAHPKVFLVITTVLALGVAARRVRGNGGAS